MSHIRLLRGQVVVREVRELESDIVWTPQEGLRQMKTHRGVVLAKGPPATIYDHVEVPHDFEVGDMVQYHLVHNYDKHTREWEDGKLATWLPQNCIDAVIEP